MTFHKSPPFHRSEYENRFKKSFFGYIFVEDKLFREIVSKATKKLIFYFLLPRLLTFVF